MPRIGFAYSLTQRDVLRAGLRALEREGMGEAWRDWQEARHRLAQDQITVEVEQEIEQHIRASRRAEKRKASS